MGSYHELTSQLGVPLTMALLIVKHGELPKDFCQPSMSQWDLAFNSTTDEEQQDKILAALDRLELSSSEIEHLCVHARSKKMNGLGIQKALHSTIDYEGLLGLFTKIKDENYAIKAPLMERLIEKAATFQEFEKLVARCRPSVAHKDLILREMAKLASTAEDWVSIYKHSLTVAGVRPITTLEEIRVLELDLDRWHKIYAEAKEIGCPELCALAFEKMGKLI